MLKQAIWHNFSLSINMMKYRYFLTLQLLLFFTLGTYAQGDVINDVRAALKAGSSKEVVKLLNKSTDLDFDGENSSYGKTQAEAVLKDFFKKNPPTDFKIIHQGASNAGAPYVIGQYSYKEGSFRVLIRLKEEGSLFRIHAMSFYKD